MQRSSPIAALGALLVALSMVALAAHHRARGAPHPSAGVEPVRRVRVTGPLDLNRASAADLEALPRIGPALAARIIAHREAHDGFRSVEELVEVSGIGPRTLEALRPLVMVAPRPEPERGSAQE